MIGRVTRLLRRPAFWKAGLTVGDVLFLTVFFGVCAVVVSLLLIELAARAR